MNDLPKDKAAIYAQDCEFYRHHDKLKWSRFQTLAVVEGALLFALHQWCLDTAANRVLMVFGFLMVLIICLLALKDENDENGHERRLMKFEKDCEVPFKRVSFPPIPSGTVLMWIGIVLINVFNILVVIKKW